MKTILYAYNFVDAKKSSNFKLQHNSSKFQLFKMQIDQLKDENDKIKKQNNQLKVQIELLNQKNQQYFEENKNLKQALNHWQKSDSLIKNQHIFKRNQNIFKQKSKSYVISRHKIQISQQQYEKDIFSTIINKSNKCISARNHKSFYPSRKKYNYGVNNQEQIQSEYKQPKSSRNDQFSSRVSLELRQNMNEQLYFQNKNLHLVEKSEKQDCEKLIKQNLTGQIHSNIDFLKQITQLREIQSKLLDGIQQRDVIISMFQSLINKSNQKVRQQQRIQKNQVQTMADLFSPYKQSFLCENVS